jgi:hypothetical protein
MFQTRTCGGKEGFNKLWFAEFGEESEGIASNVFVGVLKIIANAIAVRIKVLGLRGRRQWPGVSLPD